jgi:DNA-binding NarL/FixJ family response regulator
MELPMNLVIVDDHDIFRQSLALLLDHRGGHQVLGTFASAEALLSWEGLPPDAILLDYHMPANNAWQVLAQLQQRWPEVPVVFLTGTGSVAVLRQIVASSAAGVLHKRDSAETILALLAKIGAGERVVSAEIRRQIDDADCGFTGRELEVLGCLMQGLSAEAIAASLHISRRTVEKHKENMMRKAAAHNLAQLIELGHRLELR